LQGLVYIGLVPTARAPLMATLSGSAGQPNFVAAITATGNSLTIVPASLLTTDPRAIELWLIPAGETRPRSLGLIQPGQPIKLEIPPDLAGRLTPAATLAVSLEPPGGSAYRATHRPGHCHGKADEPVSPKRAGFSPGTQTRYRGLKGRSQLHPGPAPDDLQSQAAGAARPHTLNTMGDQHETFTHCPADGHCRRSAGLSRRRGVADISTAEGTDRQPVGGSPMFPSRHHPERVNSKDHTTLVGRCEGRGPG